MLSKNEMIEIWVDDLTVEGAGIGRYEGLAVFVPGALPGERVRAKVIKTAKTYAAARLEQILEISPNRVQPFCEIYAQCGGCTLQHLDYDSQLAYKAKHIRDCLARIGGIDIKMPEVAPAKNQRDYRNKAAFPVAEEDGKAAAGFYALRSHRLAVGDCPIQQQAVNDVKNTVIAWANRTGVPAYDEQTGSGVLRHIVARQSSRGEITAGVVVRAKVADDALVDELKGIDGMAGVIENINPKKTNVIFGEKTRVIAGRDEIIESYEDLEFAVSLQSFLQVNHTQSAVLYEKALAFADIQKTDTVLDLFCGIGTISLLAAKRAASVIGVEYSAQAVENAKRNAARNGIENAAFLAGDAAAMIDEAAALADKPDVVILDPPRKGCDNELIWKIADLKPDKIVYVSCNPATLARDAKLFCDGGYQVKDVAGVDMFPQTTHVESVILMVKAGTAGGGEYDRRCE